MHLGDGIEGQTEYMFRLIEDAPVDIDGVAAMIMEEAASRINEELCNEVLRLIAVTRHGLREADLNIYSENAMKHIILNSICWMFTACINI